MTGMNEEKHGGTIWIIVFVIYIYIYLELVNVLSLFKGHNFAFLHFYITTFLLFTKNKQIQQNKS